MTRQNPKKQINHISLHSLQMEKYEKRRKAVTVPAKLPQEPGKIQVRWETLMVTLLKFQGKGIKAETSGSSV